MTTDHLGTPIAATSTSGALQWSGGFEPFGRDYTAPSAQDSGVFLRLPGQWFEEVWEESSLGAEVYYNVHRWFEGQTGRYTRPDPLRFANPSDIYGYANDRPTVLIDRLGLQVGLGTATYGPSGSEEVECCATALSQGFFEAAAAGGLVICCNGAAVPCALVRTGLSVQGLQIQSFLARCILEHETSHIIDLPPCPPQCGVTPADFASSGRRRRSECTAYGVEVGCLMRAKPLCANDPICLSVIQQRIEQAQSEQNNTWGCTP